MSLPGSVKVNDGYTCTVCGQTAFTTTGMHYCSGARPSIWISTPPTVATGSTYTPVTRGEVASLRMDIAELQAEVRELREALKAKKKRKAK